jgi:L-ascorbate metabolism protein UlaG (beta-lactamase superfamily)
MRITVVGHATVLLETGDYQVIVDPYFGSGGNVTYKRLAPPARTREALAGVDLVLASHNHWDHIDGRYLRLLADEVPVVAPRWTSWMTRLIGARRVVGMRTWESRQFGPVTVTPVPALHIAVTIGYVIQAEGKDVYCAGDTYYGDFMHDIGRRFQLDAALMPVTTFRIPMTVGERSAVRAVQALQPAAVIPIHLGLQPRSPLMRSTQTAEGFVRRLREAGLQTEVAVLPKGETWTLT